LKKIPWHLEVVSATKDFARL